MKIVFVYADNKQEWNSSEWRCVIPAQAIDRSPEHQADLLAVASFANRTPEAEQLCSQADLIVVERNLFGPVLTAIMHWKAQGKGVIATFDDAYHLLPKDNLSHDFWLKGIARKKQDGKVVQEIIDPPPITQFKWGLRMVDGAVVASKKLVEDWEEFTDVRHLPMYLDLERYRDLPEKEPEDDTVVIGWSGSLSHLHSFSSGILEALERVARARPQVRLKIGNDRRIYDRLNVPDHQKELTPWVPYEEWPQVLSSYDIGLAPMEGEFDARRSWVKVLEYMAVKVPWIASRSPAYQDLASYGVLVENTAEEWEAGLLKIIDNIDGYQIKAAGEPYQFALSQNADRNVDLMVQKFSEITGISNKQPSTSSILKEPTLNKKQKRARNKKDKTKDIKYKKRLEYWKQHIQHSPFNPQKMIIETMGNCNRTCHYCPVSIHPKRQGRLDSDVVFDLLDQLKSYQYDRILHFHFYNEPLLDKRIPDFLSYGRQILPKAHIKLVTNGDLLTHDYLVKLIHTDLSLIKVSAHDQKTESRIKSIQTKLPRKMRQKVKVVNYYDGSAPLMNRGGSIEIDPDSFDLRSPYTSFGCDYALNFHVTYQGNVILCCNDFHGEVNMGNIHTQSLEEIWEDSKPIRKEIFLGYYEKYDICQECIKALTRESETGK
jgi:radical SAM protein with 4Fe4S-binding SPASM domain